MQLAAVGLPVALAAGDAFLRERLDDDEQLAAVQIGDVQPLAVSFVGAHVERLARCPGGASARARELIARNVAVRADRAIHR